jgi:hypothetical protein
VNNAYTWANTTTPPVYFSGTAATAFLNQLNSAAFAGHTDWRLPTAAPVKPDSLCIPELESIERQGRPAIDSAVFGPTGVGKYWGACFDGKDKASTVDFGRSATAWTPVTEPNFVRAVRSMRQ